MALGFQVPDEVIVFQTGKMVLGEKAVRAHCQGVGGL